MVQGSTKFKSAGTRKQSNNSSAKMVKKVMKEKLAKIGQGVALPKKHFRDEALDDRALSKAIAKASEVKVSTKLVQEGGKLALKDVLQKGKEASKDLRRSQLKKKVGRVEQKLNALKAKEDR